MAVLSMRACSLQTLVSATLATMGAGTVVAGAMRNDAHKDMCCLIGGCILAASTKLYAQGKSGLTDAVCFSLSLASVGVSILTAADFDASSRIGQLGLAVLVGGGCIMAGVMGSHIIYAEKKHRPPHLALF